MLNIERILKQDRLVRAMTGLNRQAFYNLLPTFAAEYTKAEEKRDKSRQRAIGGGAKAKLATSQAKLFYIMSLVVCGIYPSVGAAYKAFEKVVGVSKVSLYAKINGLEPKLSQC